MHSVKGPARAASLPSLVLYGLACAFLTLPFGCDRSAKSRARARTHTHKHTHIHLAMPLRCSGLL